MLGSTHNATHIMMLHIMLANFDVAVHITTFDDLFDDMKDICRNIVSSLNFNTI